MGAKLTRIKPGEYTAADGRFTIGLTFDEKAWQILDREMHDEVVAVVPTIGEVRRWIELRLTPVCTCMTEDPGDGFGERVVTHSGGCPLAPEPAPTIQDPTWPKARPEWGSDTLQLPALDRAVQASQEVVQAGREVTVRVLKARWTTSRRVVGEKPTDSNVAEEIKRWNQLIDYIDEHGLAGTDLDPRPTKEQK